MPRDDENDRDDNDRSDRPRRRRRDRDDDDYDRNDRPRRKRGDPPPASGAKLVIIILGVVILLVAGAVVALYPAIERATGRDRRKDQVNLHQIGRGVHNYCSANQDQLPLAGDKVSWRVHILPYIEQDNVYRRMDVKQPWDAPVNRQWASTRIPTYASYADPPETVETRYRVFVGPNTLYPNADGKARYNIGNIPDGTSNTFYAVEAAELVPWPQPKELTYDRTVPLPPLGAPGRKGFNVLMADGSVRFFSDKISPNVLRLGIEPDDGQVFNPDE